MKLVFLAEEFELRTPVQQLLDRFLIGFPREGKFHKPDCEVTLVLPNKNEAVERRIKDFGLRWEGERPREPYDGELIFSPEGSRSRSDRNSQRAFVYGATTSTTLAGTAVRGAWHLPQITVPKNTRLEKALVIVQGTSPMAEVEAFDALLPLIWERKGGEAGVRGVTPLDRSNFWEVLKGDFWPLVRSAISRSDTPQGDPVRDGRTQDLAGLGLLETLVKEPRGWLIKDSDGFQYVIAMMDGAVADYNVAVQTAAGGIISAQVYRPPAPAQHHYSRLAAMLEGYFRTGIPPWPLGQVVYVADLLRRFDPSK
jgi:hypothetical protein